MKKDHRWRKLWRSGKKMIVVGYRYFRPLRYKQEITASEAHSIDHGHNVKIRSCRTSPYLNAWNLERSSTISYSRSWKLHSKDKKQYLRGVHKHHK